MCPSAVRRLAAVAPSEPYTCEPSSQPVTVLMAAAGCPFTEKRRSAKADMLGMSAFDPGCGRRFEVREAMDFDGRANLLKKSISKGAAPCRLRCTQSSVRSSAQGRRNEQQSPH